MFSKNLTSKKARNSRSRQGTSAVEYALIIALVVLGTVGTISSMTDTVSSSVEEVRQIAGQPDNPSIDERAMSGKKLMIIGEHQVDYFDEHRTLVLWACGSTCCALGAGCYYVRFYF
ncbi:MAG: Flp family type IVb pilin [Planctomycetota bacterium]